MSRGKRVGQARRTNYTAPNCCYSLGMKEPTRANSLDLRSPEQLRLLEDTWDTFVADSDTYLLSDADRETLELRLEAMEQNPHAGSDWSELRQRILSRA